MKPAIDLPPGCSIQRRSARDMLFLLVLVLALVYGNNRLQEDDTAEGNMAVPVPVTQPGVCCVG